MIHKSVFRMVSGHIIASVDTRDLLIDTGSPVGIGEISPLSFSGGHYPVEGHFSGISIESLSVSVGTMISALIGTDILNRYDLLIDPAAGIIQMTEDELSLEGE